MTNPLQPEDERPGAWNDWEHAAPPVRVSALMATLMGWLAVALWNAGDIARMPVRPDGAALRLRHHVADLGHVMAVALIVAAGVALWRRYGPRRRIWSVLAVALTAGAVSPIVLSKDLAGGLERLFPSIESEWFLPAVCVVTSQVVTAAFLGGRLFARPRLRWVATALGVSLLVANDFVLRNGYPGAHVLLLATGATLIAASLAGAGGRWLGRLSASSRIARRGKPAAAPESTATAASSAKVKRRGVKRWLGAVLRPVSLLWGLAAAFAAATIVRTPSSGLQIELLERDTPLLFRWLRPLYAPSEIGGVPIPRELRHWFENRSQRPDLHASTQRFLPEGPIVILITIDSLRSDVLEPRYRYAAPNLHDLRKNSVYFAQARSSSTDTILSLATLFTGRHNSMLNWTTKPRRRKTIRYDRLPRFPELLQKAGVQTVAAMTISMMEARVGMARGFAEELRETRGSKYRTHSDEVADQIIDRLRRHGSGPFFFYTHLLDPHAPYMTYGKPAKTQFDAYLIDVSVADENVGRIRRAIEELGLKHRTAFIVSADHGEGFGEHRIFTHGKALYDILVHVPLMIELPGVRPRTVNDFVAVMDLAPTVLDLFGVPTPGSWTAESLTPFLAGGQGDPTRVILMEKNVHKAMLFPDGLKVMKRRGAYEIYDVRRDPGEIDNLWEKLGEESERRLALLNTYVDSHAKNRTDEEDSD